MIQARNGNAPSVPQVYWTAGVALAAGVGVYLCDRPAQSVYVIPDVVAALQSAPGGLNDSLPTLLHSFAFALLVAATWRAAGRAGAACGGWFAVEAVLEAVQHPAVGTRLAAPLGDSAGAIGALRGYLLGTFDPADLAAAGIGCLAAYVVLTRAGPMGRGRSAAHG